MLWFKHSTVPIVRSLNLSLIWEILLVIRWRTVTWKNDEKVLLLVHQNVKFKLKTELSGKLPNLTPHTPPKRSIHWSLSNSEQKRLREPESVD